MIFLRDQLWKGSPRSHNLRTTCSPPLRYCRVRKRVRKNPHFHTNLERQTTLSLTKAHETNLMKLKSKFTFQRNHMYILKEEAWKCLCATFFIIALDLLSFFWFVSVYFNLEICLHYIVKPHKEYGHHGTLFLLDKVKNQKSEQKWSLVCL